MFKLNYESLKNIPFLFTQTREDSLVDLNIIREFNNSNVLLIGSAGDTVVNILSKENSINKIDVIDTNNNQLCLAKLKIGLYKKYNSRQLNEILNNFNKNLKKVNYMCILNDLYLAGRIDVETRNYWYSNVKYLENGINFEGRFEKLFNIANKDHNYKQHFSDKTLKNLFGNKSTKYSKNKLFSQHFAEINKRYDNCNNYFKDSYRENKYLDKLPPYLTTECKINPNINYYLRDLMNHCLLCEKETYNVIDISNITDWTDPLAFQFLFDNIFRILKNNGKVVVRRLNGDIVISDYLNLKYKKTCTFQIRHVNDESQFYSETIIITKEYDESSLC